LRLFSKTKFLIIAFFAALALGGCVSSQTPPRPLDYPYSRIFTGTFNDVWSATVRVLDIYSITVANREAGLLQTEWSHNRFNPELYKHPDIDPVLEEVQYRLKIKLSKAYITETGSAAVRVQVLKELKEYKNFFTDWERRATDGYEEKILLYRIAQRLKIVREKKKAKSSKSAAKASE